MADDLRSQTLMTCPHCGDDFLINEAGDGSISVEMGDAMPRSTPPPQTKRGAVQRSTPTSRTTKTTTSGSRMTSSGPPKEGSRHG
jgi:hypothetical protein